MQKESKIQKDVENANKIDHEVSNKGKEIGNSDGIYLSKLDEELQASSLMKDSLL